MVMWAVHENHAQICAEYEDSKHTHIYKYIYIYTHGSKSYVTFLDNHWFHADCKSAIIRPYRESALIDMMQFSKFRFRQNASHFTDNIFKGIFLKSTVCILIQISLNMFLKAQLTVNQHWSRNNLGSTRNQAITCTNVDNLLTPVIYTEQRHSHPAGPTCVTAGWATVKCEGTVNLFE